MVNVLVMHRVSGGQDGAVDDGASVAGAGVNAADLHRQLDCAVVLEQRVPLTVCPIAEGPCAMIGVIYRARTHGHAVAGAVPVERVRVVVWPVSPLRSHGDDDHVVFPSVGYPAYPVGATISNTLPDRFGKVSANPLAVGE